MRQLINYWNLVLAYCQLNLKSQLEYRGAFASQALAMFFNNCVWLLFWTLFFTKFAVLRGWSIRDVILLWAIAAAGFGLAHGICGNAWFLPTLIMRGELDAWLLYPRRLLPHIVLGKMYATAWGDALFGFSSYFFLLRPDLPHAILFICLALTVAILFIGFAIGTGSLAFLSG